MEEQKLYWGMHFCNSRMFKTIVKVEMYIREQQAEGITLPVHTEEHTKYYMTEHGQILSLIKQSLFHMNLICKIWSGFRIRTL